MIYSAIGQKVRVDHQHLIRFDVQADKHEGQAHLTSPDELLEPDGSFRVSGRVGTWRLTVDVGDAELFGAGCAEQRTDLLQHLGWSRLADLEAIDARFENDSGLRGAPVCPPVVITRGRCSGGAAGGKQQARGEEGQDRVHGQLR
jgi:hypothetical protein